jgi:dsDNA-specific endonuclease/ATPase MutS2
MTLKKMGTRFKDILDSTFGIRFIFSKLNLSSALSGSLIKESRVMTDVADISEAYRELAEFNNFVNLTHNNSLIEKIKIELFELRDIRNTLIRISEGSIPDDIELFEIKSLSMINQKVKTFLESTEINCIKLPDLEDVINLLDPEGNRITSFYIYDAYSSDLKEIRKEISSGYIESEDAIYKMSLIEDRIRGEIYLKLSVRVSDIYESLINLARVDTLIAKARQLKDLNLIIPSHSINSTSYSGMFNPEVKEILKSDRKEYQLIDIEFTVSEPLLITGSNMGGKSLTLKTLALCQYLYQFGFGIPAREASIVAVDKIFLSVGDEQDYRKGLSSFAAEIKRIDNMLSAAKGGKLILSLTDEPAGSTNPKEGTALATALLKVLMKKRALSVVTTHYNIENIVCKRLKVVGFENGVMNYKLSTAIDTSAPGEALRIAEAMGADSEWISIAKAELGVNKR